MVSIHSHHPKYSTHNLNRFMATPLTSTEYRKRWKDGLARSRTGMSATERKYYFYSKYNWERQEGVSRRYEPSPAFREAVNNLPEGARLLYLTEDWCIDSAYSFPVVDTIPDIRRDISLEIYIRDENLDLMDRFLTNGGRSVPKLIIRDADRNDLCTWGPKVGKLVALRTQLQEEGADGPAVVNATSEWYENEGWLEIERELTETLASCVPAASLS